MHLSIRRIDRSIGRMNRSIGVNASMHSANESMHWANGSIQSTKPSIHSANVSIQSTSPSMRSSEWIDCVGDADRSIVVGCRFSVVDNRLPTTDNRYRYLASAPSTISRIMSAYDRPDSFAAMKNSALGSSHGFGE